MPKISFGICLLLLVALSNVYETQAQGTFSLLDYMQQFPKISKDFEPYANKGLIDFIGILEGKSPTTIEFKNFFTKLRDYISVCFKPTHNIVEISQKSDQLFMAISALKGTKDGTSFDSWRLFEGLISMQKTSDEIKKSPPTTNEMSDDQWNKLYGTMTEWVGRIGLFVKSISEINGKLIDLAQFDIDYANPTYFIIAKEVGNKTIESFSLPLQLKNFPKMGKDFEPFVSKVMLDFISELEVKCPANPEFKNFFVKLNNYMAGFKTLSPETYSIESNVSNTAMPLFIASSTLDGTKVGTSNPWKLVDGLLSMGEVLVKMKKNALKEITFEERKELTLSIVKWARGISQFVRAASEKKGVTINLSAYDNFYNSNGFVSTSANTTSNPSKPM